RFANTAPACRGVCPGEEGQDGARTTGLVTEIEVVSRWIVEVDCLFDKAQPEIACVEAQILEGIAGDRRHVVDAWQICLLDERATLRKTLRACRDSSIAAFACW